MLVQSKCYEQRGSVTVSGHLLTYPSPKPKLILTYHILHVSILISGSFSKEDGNGNENNHSARGFTVLYIPQNSNVK